MALDFSKPIEIAEDIFWIGYVVPNDSFQCHVYLIRNGEESILIDPGSELILPIVLEKLFLLIPLKNVKYIIMHHQDPDITGSFSTLEKLFPPNQQRFIVTHWRTKALLKHCGWKTPYYLIDEHNWKLKAGDRELEFVFTPYAHFPGAFCTFDPKTKTLFSSDIFGAISDKFFLFAEDSEDYYKGVEFFHKHYMPSKYILEFALQQIMSKSPEIIAPQHGSIIKKNMIDKVVSRLKNLDCGLYLLDVAREENDIQTLTRVESWVKRLFDIVIFASSFENILKAVYEGLKEDFPDLEELIVIGRLNNEKIIFTNKNGNISIDRCSIEENVSCEENLFSGKNVIKDTLNYNGEILGYLVVTFSKMTSSKNDRLVKLLLSQIKNALSVAFKKELELLALEKEVEQDPLTGLYNKRYLLSFIKCLIDSRRKFSLAFIDLDKFKKINDTYGHLTGDCVLKELASILKRNFRKSDCVARFGGEEFVVVGVDMDESVLCRKVNRIRIEISNMEICDLKVTFSAGVTQFKEGDSLRSILERADSYLYKAKQSGRNIVICDSNFR